MLNFEILERGWFLYITFCLKIIKSWADKRIHQRGGEYLILRTGADIAPLEVKILYIKNHGADGASGFKVVQKKNITVITKECLRENPALTTRCVQPRRLFSRQFFWFGSDNRSVSVLFEHFPGS